MNTFFNTSNMSHHVEPAKAEHQPESATHRVRDGLLGLLREDVGEDSTQTHADPQHVDRSVRAALQPGLKWEERTRSFFFLSFSYKF